MPRAQEMRGKSVLRLTRWRRSRAARGARRGPLGCAYNVTDAEFACIGSGGIPHILYRRCDRDVTDATDGANRCVGYGRQAKARPMPRASIPRPELRGGTGSVCRSLQRDERLKSIISREPESLHW